MLKNKLFKNLLGFACMSSILLPYQVAFIKNSSPEQTVFPPHSTIKVAHTKNPPNQRFSDNGAPKGRGRGGASRLYESLQINAT